MPLSNTPVSFPPAMPNVPFKVECIRGASRSGLNRDQRYTVRFVVYNATTHRGENAKGYIVSKLDGEMIPVLWHPSRFRIVED